MTQCMRPWVPTSILEVAGRKSPVSPVSTKALFVQTRFLSVSLQTVFPLCSFLHVTSGQSIPVIKHDLGLERWLSS